MRISVITCISIITGTDYTEHQHQFFCIIKYQAVDEALLLYIYVNSKASVSSELEC